MPPSTADLARFIADPGALDVKNRQLAIAGVEDTLGVALAGWNEPVSLAARGMYAGGAHPLIDGSTVLSAEYAAFAHAVAGHALDFDDVHLVSTTHPSVVLVPALLAAAHEFPTTRARMLTGYAIGIAMNVPLRLDMTSISVKLYPCCYGAHRMIAAALALREAVPDVSTRSIEVRAPAGQLQPLRVTDPKNGLEAKFCARYIVATALLRGEVTLQDFADEAVRSPERRALMERVVVTGTSDASDDYTLDGGVVTLGIAAGDRNETVTVSAYPGSPRSPATEAQRAAKLRDCLHAYEVAGGARTSLETFRATVARLCAPGG